MSPPADAAPAFALYVAAAMAQLCAVHLARSKVLGDFPILGIGWASPKLGNEQLANWVAQAPNVKILRLRAPVDPVSNSKIFKIVKMVTRMLR